MQSSYVQRDQPEGVPPLSLTGERTLPDVPEENYWYRRHLVVYEWIAERVRGRRVIDMASGEGYGSDVLARTAAFGGRGRGKPRGVRARTAALPRGRRAAPGGRHRVDGRPSGRTTTSASSGRSSSSSTSRPTPSSSCRRSSTSRTRAGRSSTSARSSATAAPSTSRRRTCSRSPRRARRGPTTPGTCTSTGPRSSNGCAAGTSSASSSTASSTPASCASTSSRCGSAGTGCTPRCGLTRPLLRLVHARDRRRRLRDASRPPGGSARRAGPARGVPALSGRSERGALAIVLHTHMPYVEGFGTWPFGEEWLWEAIAGSYLPLLELLDRGAPLTLSLTPVLCDQLEVPGVADRFGRLRRGRAARDPREDAEGLRAGGHEQLAAELERAWGDYARAAERLAGLGRRHARRARRRMPTGRPRRPTRCCRCSRRARALREQVRAGVRSHRRRFGAGWRGGFWLPECAHEPSLEPALLEAGVQCGVRGADRAARARRAPRTCAPCWRSRGWCWCPWTA